MTYESNLNIIDLSSISRSDIKTFQDFGMLANHVKSNLNTIDRPLIEELMDTIKYLVYYFPISAKHSDYIKKNFGVNTLNVDAIEERKTGILRNYETIETDLYLRPFVAIFSQKDYLNFNQSKDMYVPKEVFEKLVEKFWPLVKVCQNILSTN
jgi:hypothetical protein